MLLRYLIAPVVAGTILAQVATAQVRWPADKDRYQLGNLALKSAPVCRRTVPLLTKDSLGPLRPGQTLHDVERACPQLLYGWDWGNEGVPTPAVVLRFGAAVIEVELADTLSTTEVYRISTDSRLVKTVDGFGSGSSLAAMIRAWGSPTFGVGECVLYTWFASRPGLSFRVAVPKGWQCEDVHAVEQGQQAKLPKTTTVREVLLVQEGK